MPAAAAATQADGDEGGAEVDGRPLHVTPAVRMLAREHGLDLGRVAGTGIGGRITKRDVLNFVQQQGAQSREAATPAPEV